VALQRTAYVSEAVLYDDTGLSALSEPLEENRKLVAAGEALVAKMDSRIVGAVRGVRKGTSRSLSPTQSMPFCSIRQPRSASSTTRPLLKLSPKRVDKSPLQTARATVNR
jgi:hypothetical protein